MDALEAVRPSMFVDITVSAIERFWLFNSSVFVLLLDASKAFDRVNNFTLFTDLLKCEVSPFILRLLLHMYTNHTLCVR